MTDDTEHDEGWGFPALGRRWHYFTEPVSLCRKWMFFGALTPDTPGARSAEDCRECTRRLAQRKAAQ